MHKLAIAMKNVWQIISEEYSGLCVRYFLPVHAFKIVFIPLRMQTVFEISSENDPTAFQGRRKGISLRGHF